MAESSYFKKKRYSSSFPLRSARWVWLWSDVCLSSLEWSAPSAIGIAGLGGGFEIGIEVRGQWYAHDCES